MLNCPDMQIFGLNKENRIYFPWFEIKQIWVIITSLLYQLEVASNNYQVV